MSNINTTIINFTELTGAAKQVLLDLFCPVGTYFSNDSEAFNTVEKVEAHFGGKWEKITERVLYAVETGAGVNTGSNTITLTTDNLPTHNHTFNGDNITGGIQYLHFDYEYINDKKANGPFSFGDKKNYWNKSGTGTHFSDTYPINFNYTPKGTITNAGNSEAIDLRGARRTTYCYRRYQ